MTKRMTDEEADALVERVTRALDVPEPSPLFWDHFPERVRAAVAAEPLAPAAASVWWRRPIAAFGLAAVLVAGGAALGWRTWIAAPAGSDAPAAAAADRAVPEDQAWAVVASIAATAGPDALGDAGFGVAPGDADAALDDLTDAERAAFAAILIAEMKGEDTGGL